MKTSRQIEWFAALLLLAAPAWAQQSAQEQISVDIRAQPIGDALNELARQAGVQILFYSEIVEGLDAARLAGSFTTQAALERLLTGTPLRYEFINDKTVAIRSSRSGVTDASRQTQSATHDPLPARFRLAQNPQSRAVTPAPAAESDARSALKQPVALEELVVTGTRVPGRYFTEVSPVAVATAEEIKFQGAVNLEAVIRDIPSAAPGRSATTNNNGNGNATLNLRNLGDARTLTLIDGKRMVGVDFTGIPDINAIPTKMIERIEVVTGGASAVYGSDAIAGVVNFILRKDFEGIETDVQYGAFDEGDGDTLDASIVAGLNLPGQGNITAHIGYTQREPVYRRDRSWAETALISDGTRLVPFFSSVAPGGRDLNTGLVFGDDRTLIEEDGRVFNNAPNQFIVVPQERYILGASGHFDLADSIQPYFRLSFSQNKVDRQLSETPFTAPVLVNYGNPLLSAQQRSILFDAGLHANGDIAEIFLSRRLVEEGNIQELNNYQTFQMVAGARGDIGAGFNYDVSAQYGDSSWTQRLLGDVSYSRFQQGLLLNPDGSCTNPIGGCVGIDIFTAQPGAITDEQVNFFALKQQASSSTSQFVASGTIAGDLRTIGAKSPWAEDAIAIAVGLEYRKEKAAYRPDDNLASGNNLIFGVIPLTQGRIDVRDQFAEIRVPLVQDLPALKLLEINSGYRHSDYNLAGTAEAYKYGLVWAPLDSVRLRASFQRAVRAPNIGELFAPAQPSADSGVDPCFGNNGNGPSAASELCQQTGVPAAAYGNALLQCPSGQCTALLGGNLDLSSERSNTRSFGLVLQPSFAEPLTLTLDYFDIDVRGAITAFGASLQNVLNNCYGTSAGQNPAQDPSNVFCQQIVRDPTGRVHGGGRLISPDGYVSLLNSNIGFLQTKGIDIELAGQWNLADIGLASIPGSVSLSLLGTHVSSYEQLLDPSSPSRECAGTYGLTCGQPNPKWRTNTRITWSASDALSLSLRWRWIDSVTLDVDTFSGTISDPPSHEIGSQSYLDLSGRWGLTDNLDLRAGVSNALDESPPLLSITVAGASNRGLSNTFPATYDIGRQYFLSLTTKF
jgi:iron complex outermembrane recepter protein